MSHNLLYSNDIAGRYPGSWYAATADCSKKRAALSDDKRCDVCVVGAGFTGLSAAISLAEAGLSVVVLDAHRVGWGASGRNGGQLGSGQRLEQDELEQRYGHEQAHAMWTLAERAKSTVKDLIRRHRIECELTPGIIHTDHKARYTRDTEAYVEKLQRDYQYQQIEFAGVAKTADLLGTDQYYSASIDAGAAHLHPLKYAIGLAAAAEAAGAAIYEETQVSSITHGEPVKVQTAEGVVTADSLILACNGYLGDLNAEVAARVMPINNYILATEPLPADTEIIRNNMAVADSRFVVNYFRKSPDNRLLFGGRESYGYRFPADIKRFVRQAMIKVYPQLQHIGIDYGWGGTLAITMNRLPHIKSLAANVYTASGYSGHGVGMATLSGKLIAEVIQGESEGFNILGHIDHQRFPGGVAMRSPLLKLAMLYYTLRDRI
jgi:gamma-glutamylputrescine oxidase